jgi:hypothetical protein
VTTQLISTLRCPACGHDDALTMPTDACLFFHPCAACGTMLRPKAGDCCVFCSFGSVPCPPVQEGAACCGGSNGAEARTEPVSPMLAVRRARA